MAWEQGRVENEERKLVVAVRQAAAASGGAARKPAPPATTVAGVASGAAASGSQKRMRSDMKARCFHMLAPGFRCEALLWEAGGSRRVRSSTMSGTGAGIGDDLRRGRSRSRGHSPVVVVWSVSRRTVCSFWITCPCRMAPRRRSDPRRRTSAPWSHSSCYFGARKSDGKGGRALCNPPRGCGMSGGEQYARRGRRPGNVV